MKPAATWCLHPPFWPEADRQAWDTAFRGDDWLDDAGLGFHLRPKTRKKYAEGYGHWLAWLSDHDFLDPNLRPEARATPERLYAYANWMRERVAPVTVRIRIEDLGLTLRLIAPSHDRKVFTKILDRLPKKPIRDKRRQLADPHDLISLGTKLMDQAEAGEFGPARYNAVVYRDGLIIALCASRPLRRSNLANLRIGATVKSVAGKMRIVISGDETKTRQAIDVTWPEPLLVALDRYVSHWRPQLFCGHPDSGALWLSRWGKPLLAHTLACNFRRHTETAFGIAISPHRFRDAAATMMAIRDPENVRAAAAVLGHKSYRSTQKHYNLSRQLEASRYLQDSIEVLVSGD